MHPVHSTPRPRGSATTLVAALLALALLVATAWSQRHVLAELRIAARQQQAQQATAAAEAGVAWALARLADPRPIGPDCLAGAVGTPLRGLVAPAATDVAACVAEGSGWRCHCPSAGAATLSAGAAGFRVTLQSAGSADRLRIAATGCAGPLAACDAVARTETSVAWLPPLARLPAAPLAVRGRIDAGGAAIGLHHADPASGGITVHAGGSLNAPAARITPPAGSLRADGIVAGDAAFTALADPVAALLGIDGPAFAARALPFDCGPDDCTTALRERLVATQAQSVHVAGDLHLAGPASIGSADRPVLVVVDGDVDVTGDLAFHGVLVARHLVWTGGQGPAARVHGGVLLSGDATLAAPVDFIHDARLLARLQAQAALPVPVPGSARDF
jgi:hypothetical protein